MIYNSFKWYKLVGLKIGERDRMLGNYQICQIIYIITRIILFIT